MTISMDTSTPQFFPKEIPFLAELGVEFLGISDGKAQIALNLEPRHMNSWQVTHGGMVMTMLDVAMAMAGRSLNPEVQGCVTIDMHTTFMQAGGKVGDRVIAKGRATHRSATLCFCEGELWVGDILAAKSMGTFKYLRRLDAAKRPEQPYITD